MAVVRKTSHRIRNFLWSAPAVPLFIGISFVSLILSVQILITLKGESTDARHSTHQTLTDAR